MSRRQPISVGEAISTKSPENLQRLSKYYIRLGVILIDVRSTQNWRWRVMRLNTSSPTMSRRLPMVSYP